ncbi:MAG: hypothetical protein IPG34_14495 [Rhodocyclaceae bacterium]|nr:hypothetical protein [Rhodocyclaceae bacterium]
MEPHGHEQSNARVHLSRIALRSVYRAVAFAVIFVLIAGQAHMGFVAVIALGPLMLWLSFALYVMVNRPYLRVATAIGILAWVGAFVVLSLIHYVRYSSARNDANEVVSALRDYVRSQGRCPQQLSELSVTRPTMPAKLRADFVYSCEGRQPKFAYFVTYTVLDTYAYDFKQASWRYQSWAAQKGYISPG